MPHRFQSGRFFIDGFGSSCPAWTAAEKTTVNNTLATIQADLATIINPLAAALGKSASDMGRTIYRARLRGPQATYFNRLANLLSVACGVYTATFNTCSETYTLRKMDLGTSVFARAEGFMGGSRMTIDRKITLNINTAKDFFAATTRQQEATLFHEMTHFFGTEDHDTPILNDAEFIDDIFEKKNMRSVTANLHRLLNTAHGQLFRPAKRAGETVPTPY